MIIAINRKREIGFLSNNDFVDLASSDSSSRSLVPANDHEISPSYIFHHAPTGNDHESLVGPRYLIHSLTTYWYLTIPFAILLAGLSATAILMTFTPVYRANAVMKIASYAPYIAYTTPEPQMNPEDFTETQIELIRSSLVAEQVLEDSKIAGLPGLQSIEKPIVWLTENIRVQQVGSSELYNVSLETSDPESSAIIVNAVLDTYFAVRAKDNEDQTARVLELLGQEKQARSVEIQNLREKMRQLGQDVVGMDPYTGMPQKNGGQAGAGPLERLRERLTAAEVDRKMLEMEITAIREAIAKEDLRIAEVDVEMAVGESQEILDLRAMIAERKSMMHRVESTAAGGRNDPSYLRLESEVKGYEESLKRAVASSRPKITDQLKSLAELDRRDTLHELEARLETQLVLENLLGLRYKEMLGTAGESGNKMLELEFARAELEREERVFDLIAERSMALSTESRAPGRIVLLQPAEPTLHPVASFPLRNMAIAAFLSGCLPFGLALLWELSTKPISDVNQLTSNTAQTTVSEVAKLPVRTISLGSRQTKAMSIFEESIDSLRVGLLLGEKHNTVQTLVVTSAVHGEGKSSISSQLAVSIGRATGEPVLLIDGDLRAPDIHNIFQVSNKLGMTAVLEGRATLEEAVIRDWSDQIHLLPAGRLRVNPHQLMTRDSLNKIFDELRVKYRYIVIDTPPILSASEAILLARCADGSLLCTRRNVSREGQVKIAHDRLAKAGIKPLGTVLNGVPTRSYAKTYGSYDYARRFE